jgi:hypothetical protein
MKSEEEGGKKLDLINSVQEHANQVIRCQNGY